MSSTEDTLAGDVVTGSGFAGFDATLNQGPEDFADTLAGTGSPSPRGDGGRLIGGGTIGRYVILSKLGAGGMGVVYAAYDPELDRKVAVKMLLPDPAGASQSARLRLVREAQALARFSHPEIVAVHDVGEQAGGVWIAMEFVDGQTLGGWASERPRSWREILNIMLAAGRGVAAAHQAGLIHRDLKPDNVMVGRDGRVRVMDFGLTRSRDGASDDSPVVGAGRPAKPLSLTQQGSVLGTPAYMAPEQWAGDTVGDAADQYAYCVTLWELLNGERPFQASSLMELARVVTAGKLEAQPAKAVPTWLTRACARGLRPKPEDRWPSMQALLDQLERGQARARARRGAAGFGVVAIVAAVGFGAAQWDRATRVAECDAQGATIESTWNPNERERVRAGLLSTKLPYAEAAIETALPMLDRYASEWQVARTQACLNDSVDKIWVVETLDRSLWCLDERRMDFDALVGELARGEPSAVERSVQAIASLHLVEPCLDQDLLRRGLAPPSDPTRVRQAKLELAHARALRATGQFDEGLEVVEAAKAMAADSDWGPLVAEIGKVEGELLVDTGVYDRAVEIYETAYFTAAAAGAGDLSAETATALAAVVGDLARHDEAFRWAKHGQAWLTLAPDPSHLRDADYLNALAAVHYAAGDAQAAYENTLRALDYRETALGLEHPTTATTLSNLGVFTLALGRPDEAREFHERALAIRERTIGATHPLFATSVSNLGRVFESTGDYPMAEQHYQRAITIREAALGSKHPELAMAIGNLGNVMLATGRYPEAKTHYQAAREIFAAAYGPDHPYVSTCVNNLANVAEANGTYDEAKQLHAEALEMRERVLGSDHPDLAMSLTNLGNTEVALSEYDSAASHYRRALQIGELAFGVDHRHLAYPLLGLANIALASDQPEEAARLAERAVQIRVDSQEGAALVAEARFLVARAKWPSDPQLAMTLARTASAEASGEDAKWMRDEIDAWLKLHSVD